MFSWRTALEERTYYAWAAVVVMVYGAEQIPHAIAAVPTVSNQASKLFVDVHDASRVVLPFDPGVVRSRSVRIDFDKLSDLLRRGGGTMQVDLFDGNSAILVFDRLEQRGPSNYSWFGRVVGSRKREGSFILVVQGYVVAANIQPAGRATSFDIRHLPTGLHAIEEIDSSKFPPCGVKEPEGFSGFASSAPPLPCGGSNCTCVDDGSQVDLLVVYTPAARTAAGGVAAINASIQLGVDSANSFYVTSQVRPGFHLNLVHTQEVIYDEVNSSAILSLVADRDDGILDEVPVLREQFHADLVCIVVNNLAFGGISQLLVPFSVLRNAGYSAVRQPFVSSYILAHELGHSMGCAHQRAGANAGFFSYSFGYSFVGNSGMTFATIMAGGGATIPIAHFSNPDVLFDGQPTGVPAGDPLSADNARTISETSTIVANLRPSVPLDCNGNNVGDDQDIADGTSLDANGNGIPDECERTFYVNANAAAGGDGASWATAFSDLQDALSGTVCPGNTVTQIWVATGTYLPDRGTGDRLASFHLLDLGVYGGFAGNEQTLSERAGLFDQTILSGDLNGDDGPSFANITENSFTVVAAGGVDSRDILDGFTITGGNSDSNLLNHTAGGGVVLGGSVILRNCTIEHNSVVDRGGGVFINGDATLVDCTIRNNRTDFIGGGLYVQIFNPVLTRCSIVDNVAQMGGGLFNLSGNPVLENCLVSGNSANFAAGLYTQGGLTKLANVTVSGNTAIAGPAGGLFAIGGTTLTVSNTILWGNTDANGINGGVGTQIFDAAGNGANIIQVDYTCVQDIDPNDASVFPGTGNIDDDPLFVDTAAGDLRLMPGSPGIDAGDNTVATFTTDLAGNVRFQDDPATPDTGNGAPPIVDMGAFEFIPSNVAIPLLSTGGLVVAVCLLLAAGIIVLRRQSKQQANPR